MSTTEMTPDDFEGVSKLSKDLRETVRTIHPREAKYLIRMYYQMQRNRIREGHQLKKLLEGDEPHGVLEWLFKRSKQLEGQIRAALKIYAESNHMGRWAMAHKGIGPIIASGLLAHLDIRKARTAGAIWRYSGLDPTADKLKKGEKAPYNKDLKVICWKCGESFVKVSGNPDAYYGRVYAERKVYEKRKNEAGDYADQAARSLKEKNYRKGTEARKAYDAGRLPDARINLRSHRYAVKLFLSHWHHEAHVQHYGVAPPKPYAIAHMDHVDFIEPPKVDVA